MYRGYWVRQRLRDVIQRAKYCNDEESSLEEDIDLDMNEVSSVWMSMLIHCMLHSSLANFSSFFNAGFVWR